MDSCYSYKYQSSTKCKKDILFFNEKPLSEWSLHNFIIYWKTKNPTIKSVKVMKSIFEEGLEKIVNDKFVPDSSKTIIKDILKQSKSNVKDTTDVTNAIYISGDYFDIDGDNNNVNKVERGNITEGYQNNYASNSGQEINKNIPGEPEVPLTPQSNQQRQNQESKEGSHDITPFVSAIFSAPKQQWDGQVKIDYSDNNNRLLSNISDDYHPTRGFVYSFNEINYSCEMNNNNGVWILNDLNLSQFLQRFRITTLSLERKKNLSDIRLLSLDNIYFLCREKEKSSTKYLKLNDHLMVMDSLENIFISVLVEESVYSWCNQIAMIRKKDWKSLKQIAHGFIQKALESGDDTSFIFSDIIYTLAPKLINKINFTIEDTFAHDVLDSVFHSVFASNPVFGTEWANNFLSSCRKRKLDNTNNHSMYKPDWVLYTRSLNERFDLAICELKTVTNMNRGIISDFVKLGRQMKMMVDDLALVSVDGIVAGILVDGNMMYTYVMDLQYDGIYRMIEIGNCSLVTCLANFGNLPTIISHLLIIKSFAEKASDKLENIAVARSEGEKVENIVLKNRMRNSCGSIKKIKK